MKALLYSVVVLCGVMIQTAIGQAPVVSNVHASQRSGTKLVDIYYDLAYTGQDTYVEVQISLDGGNRWADWPQTVSGDIGQGVIPGSNKHIIWNAGIDFDGSIHPDCRFRVLARGDWVEPPDGMVFIPAGYYMFGDSLDGGPAPTEVHVEAFFIDAKETTGEQYNIVREWANAHGYDLTENPTGGLNHPIYGIGWSDAVKYANARSEYEGLTPVYYTDSTLTTVIRTNSVSISISDNRVDWEANGYRIPRIVEWEKAARGGKIGRRFPWGLDSIDHSMANYKSSADNVYDVSSTRGRHPQAITNTPYTTPVGYFPPNGYGLYDVAGNVWEWCWDKPDSIYAERSLRGGSSITEADEVRCVAEIKVYITYTSSIYGLRLARNADY